MLPHQELASEGKTTKGPRVLLVEDDANIRAAVGRHLTAVGMVVADRPEGGDLMADVTAFGADIVVLDLNLPDVDGLELLRSLRRTSSVPVIVVTGRDGEIDRVIGLELGADDYVVKPFSAAELAARIRAVLRRGRHQPIAPELTFGALRIEIGSREVLYDGISIPFTNREFELLTFLARSPRQVFSRQQMLEQVWESSSDWQDPDTVTEHVRRIRLKLTAAGCTSVQVETVRGAGYRFTP